MILNFNYLNKLTNNDLSYRNKLVLILINDLKNELLSFNQFEFNESIENMLQIIHKTKYKFNIFELKNEYDLIVKIELDLKNGNLIIDDIEKYKINVSKLINQLSSYDEMYNN